MKSLELFKMKIKASTINSPVIFYLIFRNESLVFRFYSRYEIAKTGKFDSIKLLIFPPDLRFLSLRWIFFLSWISSSRYRLAIDVINFSLPDPSRRILWRQFSRFRLVAPPGRTGRLQSEKNYSSSGYSVVVFRSKLSPRQPWNK